MIIDEMSIDPRRILQATIDSVGIGWRLVVNLLYGESKREKRENIPA